MRHFKYFPKTNPRFLQASHLKSTICKIKNQKLQLAKTFFGLALCASFKSPLTAQTSLKSTSSGEQILAQSFDIQPNPMREEAVFEFALPAPGKLRLTVTDVSGRIVSEQKIVATAGLNQCVWRFGNWSSRAVDFGL